MSWDIFMIRSGTFFYTNLRPLNYCMTMESEAYGINKYHIRDTICLIFSTMINLWLIPITSLSYLQIKTPENREASLMIVLNRSYDYFASSNWSELQKWSVVMKRHETQTMNVMKSAKYRNYLDTRWSLMKLLTKSVHCWKRRDVTSTDSVWTIWFLSYDTSQDFVTDPSRIFTTSYRDVSSN